MPVSGVAPTVELLAPVPVEHLRSGLAVLEHEPYLALGSRAWEPFAALDRERADRPVRVWLYASWNDDQPVPLSATWSALYVGHVESKGGAHPEGMQYRPPTTAAYPDDNEGWWAVFWHVTGLRELSAAERVPIATMTPWKGRKPYGHPFEPEGPILIAPVR